MSKKTARNDKIRKSIKRLCSIIYKELLQPLKTPNTVPYFTVLGQIISIYTITVYGNIQDRIQAFFMHCTQPLKTLKSNPEGVSLWWTYNVIILKTTLLRTVFFAIFPVFVHDVWIIFALFTHGPWTLQYIALASCQDNIHISIYYILRQYHHKH